MSSNLTCSATIIILGTGSHLSPRLQMVMFYTYVLRSQKNSLIYTGFTTDLKKRVQEHNKGQSFATKPYVPWKLIYYSAFETENLAKEFEVYLKSGSGKAFLNKRLIKKP